MKKSELFFSALQVPIDYFMIVCGGLVAYFLRINPAVQEIRPILYQFSLRQYAESLLVIGVFFVLVYAIDGLYNIRATKRTLKEVYLVFRATAIGLTIIIVGLFLDRDLFSSRFIILFGGVLVVVFVSFGRIALGYVQRQLLILKGIGIHRLLVIGVNGYCYSLRQYVKKNPDSGYKVMAHIDKIDLERIERIRKMKGIDEIVKCSPEGSKRDLLRLKAYCLQNKLAFKYVPTLIQTSNFNLGVFLGEPLIEIKNTPLDGWGKILKRAFDLVGAVVGLILFGIPMLFIALLIWLESGRPVIFKNERVGHKGGFYLYKFRYLKKKYCQGVQFSAHHNKKALKFLKELIEKQSIKKGPIYKIKDDPRKTKVGAFLERYSLDEFPQFLNVLRGNMSLVGPRPHQPIEVEKYEDYQKRVLTIKPGITGMAQVSGRSDLDFKDEVRLDTFYIENWSLWHDVQIILKTIPALLKRRRN